MKVVGLVGGSGTGKSTIAAHLEGRGAGSIDADVIAHDVLRDDAGVAQEIRDRFGAGVFRDAQIDRNALGRIVFGDGEALEALNAIIHPRVIGECVRRLARFEKEGKAVVVIDAALLLEVTVPFDIDVMIALRCGRDEQIRRLIEKGGASKEGILARLDNQRHIEKSFYRADAVVDTGRPLAQVLEDVDKLLDAVF